jgi:prepilin-type N-terminal cleavage/methylation domain-containing protein
MKSMKREAKSAAKRAFTLIEIMVATVIMVVLVGLVVQITSEVLKVWTRSSGKLAANAEARIAMELITQDLETAVFRNNGLQWLRVEAPLDPGGDYTDQTVALHLFAPALDRPTEDESGNDLAGDICGIAYRLAFKQSYPGGNNVYALYRYIEDPETTFNDLLGPSSSVADAQQRLTGGIWDEANVTADVNYLVSNIVEFKVFIHEAGGSVTAPVNGNSDGQVTTNYAFGGSDATETGGSQQPLLYADIVLTVVSDQGLEILQNLAENQAGTGFANTAEGVANVVRQHGEVYTRRVNFMAQAL